MNSNLAGEKMNIEKQFNLIAEEYDSNRRKFTPCFDDFYRNTTKFIVSNIEQPKQIVDLGAGTGLLTYFWYQQCPDSKYVLMDIADEMLNVARKRFADIENISYQTENYIHKLPDVFFSRIVGINNQVYDMGRNITLSERGMKQLEPSFTADLFL